MGKLRLWIILIFLLVKGSLLVLLDRVGCGKSTLLSIIAGLEEATVGEVYIERGKD